MNVIQHHHKAVELALVSAGYDLAQIRGEREVHTREVQPQGAAAVLGSVQQRTGTLAGLCVLALGLVGALETGLLAVLLAAVAAALGLHLAARYEPGVQHERHEVERPGMPRQEVLDRVTQWNEWQKMKEEAAEPDHTPQPHTGGRRH